MELDLKANKLIEEIVAVIRSNLDKEKLVEKLDDYHANDIAQSLEYLTKDERLSLYEILGDEWVSEILSYVEEPEQYINELGVEKLADIINEMDSDDAADLLEKVDESVKEKLRLSLDDDVKADIQLINSYDEDEVGSLITNIFAFQKRLTFVEQCTSLLSKQAITIIFLLFMLLTKTASSAALLI